MQTKNFSMMTEELDVWNVLRKVESAYRLGNKEQGNMIWHLVCEMMNSYLLCSALLPVCSIWMKIIYVTGDTKWCQLRKIRDE